MVTEVTDSLILIDQGRALTLPVRSRQTIFALDRAVWITQQGRSEDVVLRGCQSMDFHGRGRIVIQALEGVARLRIRHPTPRLLRRFMLRLGSLLSGLAENKDIQA